MECFLSSMEEGKKNPVKLEERPLEKKEELGGRRRGSGSQPVMTPLGIE